PRGLNIGRVPGLRPKCAQRRCGVERARPDLHVVGLKDDTAPLCPEALQGENQPLERACGIKIAGSALQRFGDSHGGREPVGSGTGASCQLLVGLATRAMEAPAGAESTPAVIHHAAVPDMSESARSSQVNSPVSRTFDDGAAHDQESEVACPWPLAFVIAST